MKPLIRWAGGKQSIAGMLYNLFPKNKTICMYYEPFLGAGSVFFFNTFERAFLSDLNNELINFYVYIKNEPKKFYTRLLQETKIFDENMYYQCRELYNKKLGDNSLAQAVRFLILNKYSYNGIYRVNTKGKYNVPFGKPSPLLPSFEEINDASKKLQKTKLVCMKYQQTLAYIEKNDFVYLDPPYPPLNKTAMFRHYTADRFSDENQEELADFCSTLDKRHVHFLLSNADTKNIRSLFQRYEIIEIEKTRFITCKKERLKVQELCIRNYHE
jgi:DNA adenine methylase